MVASARINVLTEAAEHFKLLSQYLSNPNLIVDLIEEVKTLNKLSQEEEAQYTEAKCVIQQRDAVKQEIDALQTKIVDSTAAHVVLLEKQSAELSVNEELHESIIANRYAELEKREAAAQDMELRLTQRDSQLKEKAATIKGLFGV